jgi:hypothetical protein
MPTGSHWFNFTIVHLGFAIYIGLIVYYINLGEIKKNWPLYRCNPMYMIFADNVEQNFVQCIQTSQMNFMGYLLQPLEYVTSSLSFTMGNFNVEIDSVRAMFDKVRTQITTIVESIYSVFVNIVLEFQKIIISFNDTFAKLVGIIASVIYIVDGSMLTMKSTWNGPPGQMIRRVGKCFHPNTMLHLKNGQQKSIQEVDLGDVLQGGSIVETILKIDNERSPELLYELPSAFGPIFVTGSHLIFNNELKEWEFVKNNKNAVLRPDITTNLLYCLITSDNRIQIDGHLFWDWEDHYQVTKMKH